MKAEALLEQHLVLHGPLVREGGEVGQVGQGLLNVVLVPEEHSQGLRGGGRSLMQGCREISPKNKTGHVDCVSEPLCAHFAEDVELPGASHFLNENQMDIGKPRLRRMGHLEEQS